MADVKNLGDVSTKDTGAGSKLKTGNLKRSYNMASKCKVGEVWNARLFKCVPSRELSKEKQGIRKKVGKKYGKGKAGKASRDINKYLRGVKVAT